ncbi:MAG: hypothetical protein J07AB43_13460 [Candidatus Nanosalina sp. J07AB43]|nr:MAG: hypothetical protein J07AB43_13460 [Candidatus Nanosalina sp. J07AB43]
MVGQDMVEDSLGNIEPIRVKVAVEGGRIAEKFSPSAENFEIEGNSLNIAGNDDIEVSNGGDNTIQSTFKLTPSVVSYTDSTLNLDIYDDSGNYVDTLEIEPDIRPYSYIMSSSPKSKIDFETVLRGNYEYVADIEKESPGGGGLLDSSDFGLTIKQFDDGGFGPVESDRGSLSETDFKQEEWLDWSPTPGSNENEYRIFIENMNYINELPDGLYSFELVLKKGTSDDDSIVIDRIQVDKGTVFSGRVQNSQGGGVPTEFFFDGERSVVFESRGDGRYSQEIKVGNFDYAELEFFDTGSSSYDSKLYLKKPDLSGETDLGGTGQSSIIFDYYTNPKVNVPGVDPVNMFSVKFGYDIGSVDRISTKFDASSIDPENLNVFECEDWNFASQKCNEKWSSAYDKGEDFTIDKSALPYRAAINKVSLFENPKDGKNILNNAYLLGTAADIELKNEISVSGASGGRIPAGENLSISGGIVDKQGNKLGSGYDVKVILGEGDRTFNAETDSNGDFVAEGKAPSSTGKYKITVEAEPEGFKSLSRTFSEPLTVFNEKSVSVDAPRQFSLQRDEERTIDLKVRNTGQVGLDGVALSFSGLDSSLYSVSEVGLGSIPAGQSEETDLSVEIPEAYSNAFPSLTVDVSAQADGKEVTDSRKIQLQAQTSSSQTSDVNDTDDQENNTENDSQSDQTGQVNDSDSGGIAWETPNVNKITGQFMEERSTINIALGIVTLFLMIVAVAVKKDKENGRGPAGLRNRPMSGSGAAASSVNVSASSDSQEDQYVHEESGEVFDTEEGLKMFKEMQG